MIYNVDLITRQTKSINKWSFRGGGGGGSCNISEHSENKQRNTCSQDSEISEKNYSNNSLIHPDSVYLRKERQG